MLSKKAKFNITSILTLGTGLMTFLSLFFIIATPTYNFSTAFNGFALVTANGRLLDSIITNTGLSFVKLFLCLQIIIAIFTIITPLISNMFLKQKLAEKIYMGANIACLSINFIYLIIGIAFAVKLTKEMNEGLKDSKFYCSTEVYGGLILTILLATAFFVVMFAIKTKDEESLDQTATNGENSNTTQTKRTASEIELENTKSIVETLKQYKNLFDEGIITEEDFNIMKNKLLKITKENIN